MTTNDASAITFAVWKIGNLVGKHVVQVLGTVTTQGITNGQT